MRKLLLILFIPMLWCSTHAQTNIRYIQSFDNVRYPQIAYWFFNKDMLAQQNYRNKIDSLAAYSKYTLIFLTARNGVDFFEPEKMKPILADLVRYAHQKNLKIGLQLWGTPKNTSEAASERAITENETTIDENGVARIYAKAKHVRAQSGKPFKTDILRVYLFKKTGTDTYTPGSCKDITAQCTAQNNTDSSVEIVVNQPSALKGYSVYALTQHYYKVSSNYSKEAVDKFVNIIEAYRSIPFDGVGLDEFTNLKLAAVWELKKSGEPLRERLYSLDMAKKYKETYHSDIEQTLLDMRYVAEGKSKERIKAINSYMDIMRRGSLNVETAMYDAAKKTFGAETFVGLHNCHHNQLSGDEIWQTGINWWNVKRDFGQTDEETPTPTQMGIALGYSQPILYNMYYHKKLEVIEEKAYSDLAYNIRTHYHAINDVQNWGVCVEKPEALQKINPVENCARLLNHFNPARPQLRLLIVFGREALMNWYPDANQRGICDINDKLKIEEKAEEAWKAGYLNALVPTDVIEDGRLKTIKGKPVYNGYTFDAMVMLYPQYAKENTLQWLEKYVSEGGKLLTEGSATNNFGGEQIAERWQKISSKAVATQWNIDNLAKLGIEKSSDEHAVKLVDGSWIFTDYAHFSKGEATTVSQNINDVPVEITYMGVAAIQIGSKKITKLAATALKELKLNGKTVFRLDKPADVLIEKTKDQYQITVAGNGGKVLMNELK